MFIQETLKRNPPESGQKMCVRDYLHCIANFWATVLNIFSKEIISNNTNCRKQILKFIRNTWQYWWNETNDQTLPVYIAQFLWTFKFTFSSSLGKLSIPLTNRVRGPYCKLPTEYFTHRFMAQARSARAINQSGKTRIRNLQYGPRKPG